MPPNIQPDIQPTQGNHYFELIKTALIAGIIALTVRSVAYEPFSIPSSSMVPTLLIGDYLFVSKFSYGYSQYSFPLAAIKFKGRINQHSPERGDVIVFRKPTEPNIDYIKRLVGLPGDKIQVRHGRLYINNKMMPREFVGEGLYDALNENNQMVAIKHKRYIETLPNGVQHQIIERADNFMLDNTQVFKVPPNHFFMMGDNRDGSQDSRVLNEVGFVPVENLVGRAERLFFSVKEPYAGWQFWLWPWSARFERMLQAIK